MRARFSDSEFADLLSELVFLKQVSSVEEYYKEFEALLNLSDEYSFNIFVSNLKHDISRSIRLFQPKTFIHALNLAKQMELVMYNLPHKPFTPDKNPTTQPPSCTSNPSQSRPHTSVHPS